MSLLYKFIIVFAVLGLIISVSVGFAVGNRLTHVLVTALICTLLSGFLGVGVYKVLEIKIPEFFEYFGAYSSNDYSAEVDTGASFGDDVSETRENMPGALDDEIQEPANVADGETQIFGDHILVNKVKIKNEPKLIADAIRTMIAKDED